jgi:hypothetical protein
MYVMNLKMAAVVGRLNMKDAVAVIMDHPAA